MGKEWLQWVIGGGGGEGRSSTRKGRKDKMEEAATATSAGCMCAVLQIFDLNHFQISLNQQHSSGFDATFLQEEDAATFKGVEAPRNSLELDVHSIKVGSMSLCKKGEEILNFRVGINHIKTRHEKISSPRISTKSRIDDISSECTYSPGTKTPTLVARLMGLDLLPENTPSPSFSSSNSKPKQKDKNVIRIRSNRTFSDDDISVGVSSLPETPRISSARRSDVEYPRLSLQINKENGLNEEISSKRGSRFRSQDENYKSSSSPRHFAKQIVSQVKESLSRRVGLSDITNTNNRRDENLILLNPTKKKPKVLSNCEIIPITEPSCSPKLRFLETNKNKPLPTNSNTKNPNISVKKSKEITISLKEQQKGSKKIVSLKKLPHQASDHVIRNKEDLFANKVEKRAKKKTPLISNEIVNISGPTILPVKKDPFLPVTKLPQAKLPPKQSHVPDALSSKRSTQLSCNSSYPYKQLQLHSNKIFTTPENAVPNGCATTPHGGDAPAYENYIQRILKRTGITDRDTPLTLAKWHTPSHPLDPSIFYYLELFHPSSAEASGGGGKSILSRRCNRKLIFQLVDELLVDIIKPHLDFKPWVSPITIIHNFTVVDELCKRIANFPAKNCEVLEDIDALIDKDLCKLKSKELVMEEWERIVCQIEGEIFKSLLRETVAVTVVCTAEGQRRDDSSTWAFFT